MAGPENLELLSFRRTFTLLILLVVLPSAGLSGFGVVAIVNERAAVEKRVEALWSARLTAALGELRKELELGRVESVEPFRLVVGDELVTGPHFRVEGGEVTSSDERLAAALRAVGPELEALPARPVPFSVLSPTGTYLVVAMRKDGVVTGAQVPDAMVRAHLTKAAAQVMPAGEPARLDLVPVKRDAPEGVMGKLLSGVSEVREAALGGSELASVALPAPLQDFRVVAYALGEDPVAEASTRNRVVYGVLLGLFYVALALGVIFTGRTLYREARLSRLKTDFVSLVSHELRTPLTSIRMFIEMLALGRVKEPQEMQTVLDMLSRETARLSGMIENVLDWARIESGRKQYRRADVAIDEVLEAAAEAFRAQRVGAQMDFTVEAAPGLPKVNVDKDAVAGAVLNLLQNAFKYTGAEKRIGLKAHGDAKHVVIDVEDNGVGIERRDLRRVFERFFRVDTLLTRTTEGTGLGLSIAQRIVQAHGGRISVDSTLGKGSTFRIHLPAAQA